MENYRQLLQELMDAIDSGIPVDRIRNSSLAVRIDAALEQPEPEVVGPTDDNIPLVPLSEHDLQQQWNQQADEFNQWDSLGSDEQLEWAQVRAIAATRARWGRPVPAAAKDCPACEGTPKPGNQPCVICGSPAPAPAGEVAELVAWLRERGKDIEQCSLPILANYFAQAADLIEQRHPTPVPVAVSERLPGPEDCDAEGRCWWYRYTPTPEWHLRFGRTGQHNHWLPATALPLPAGE